MPTALLRAGHLFHIAVDNPLAGGRNVHLVVKGSQQCEERVNERWKFAESQRARNRTKDPALIEQRKNLIYHYDQLVEEIGELKHRTHKEGLLGEILADLTVDDCCPPLTMKFVNYYKTGTPNLGGIDLASLITIDRDEWLVLVESKFTEQGITETIKIKDDALASISDRCESEANFANLVLQILPTTISEIPHGTLIQRMISAFKEGYILGFAYICSNNPEVDCAAFVQSSPLTSYTLSDFLSSILRVDGERGIVSLLD
jgi:hypothetical protein